MLDWIVVLDLIELYNQSATMASIKEVKFEIKRTPSRSASIKSDKFSPVTRNSVKKKTDEDSVEQNGEIFGMKSVDVVIKPGIKPAGGSPNNLKLHGVLSEIKLGKALKDASAKKKLDSPNMIREKKISNLEREKMLNKVHSKDDIKDLKTAESEVEEDEVAKSNSVIMELENVLSFEDDTESETSSVKISHRPQQVSARSPTQDGSIEDLSDLLKTDDTKESSDGKSPAFANEKGSMIDELQKFLRRKYGPIVNDASVNEKPAVVNDATIQPPEQTKLENEPKPVPVIKPMHRVPVFPMPEHPIFFKTSIKKDPGSKLHDALVSELQTVLRKRDSSENPTEKIGSVSGEEKPDIRKPPIRRISAKGKNPLLGNKALLAKFEDQLNRTLHKHKVFQRQRLKVLDLETVEINPDSSDDNISNIGSSTTTSPRENPDGIGNNGLSRKDSAKNVGIHEAVSLKKHNNANKSENPYNKPNKQVPDKQIHSSIASLANKDKINVGNHNTVPKVASSTSPTSVGSRLVESDADGLSKENEELFVYAFKHPSGRTEGVICSVERRKTTKDSRGKLRKYLTCINIVAEGSTEGCPFTQEIDDGGLPTASGGGLYFAEEDKPANFNVEVGRRKGDLRVSVSGPNSIAKCSVDPMSDGSYTVTYIPVETGIFDINVSWNGSDIPGSPYHPKVVDVRKVRVIGGWQHFMDSNERVNLVVGEKKQLPFDISEAGPGTFRAEVQGPSRAIEVDIDNHTRGRSVVEFTPEEEGSHYIHLFWSDLPLVSSPFHGYAIQHTPDASKLILTGRGLKEATVREEAEFYIDGSQAGQGTPDVVLSGVRAEVNVKTVSVGNGKFRCTYVPTIPGAYLLHITWNGRQLRGSPYKVNIMGAFYPNRVVVSGDGLRGGMLGHEMSVQIDTRKAGPGELTAYCMGPHQVAYCELQDNQDGTFRLGVRPQEPGRHVMQIKYGGEHVQNSPFVFKVTQQPDASKVRVSGPGVEHGILATFMSRFIVETRGAGAGQLTVRIRGPKGGFQVEMYRDSQRDRTILCRYDPMECGLYIISIKWSGVDVPGSPFHIHICDTQDELEHVLNDVSYSMGSYGSHRSQGSSAPVVAPQPRMVYGQWREQL